VPAAGVLTMDLDERKELIHFVRGLSKPLQPIPTGYPVRMKQDRCRAVIFDVYGTMLISAAGDVGTDSALGNNKALRLALADGGWDPDLLPGDGNIVEILREQINMTHRLKRNQGVEFPEVDIQRIWRQVLALLQLEAGDGRRIRKLALSYECRVNPSWTMPNLVETVHELMTRGTVLGIISNAQFYSPIICEALMGSSLDRFGFDDDLCIWSYREGEGKPSAHIFAQLSRRLRDRSIQPQETLMVGNDMFKDIFPAVQLGFQTALFAGDRRSLRLRQDHEQAGSLTPDMVINDLLQLV